MAGFKMHISVSTLCGIGYGLATVKMLGHPLETAFLAGGLTAIGGMLPDLDSDSGVPVRELSGVAAAVVPLLLYNRLHYAGLNHEAVLAILAAAYFLIRYGASALLKRISVHRGMFHSIPAMLISGLVVYLAYDNRAALQSTRYVLGVGVMLGFLSHLVLDEIYSVDINGLRIKLKSSAGSALKFFSSSITASMVCYGMLGALLYLSYTDYKQRTGTDPVGEQIQAWRGSR
jgi:membrane-bound metal-dependent hydrolase YbcI (DUF457 family)